MYVLLNTGVDAETASRIWVADVPRIGDQVALQRANVEGVVIDIFHVNNVRWFASYSSKSDEDSMQAILFCTKLR